MIKKHLAIFDGDFAQKIIEGIKTIETRFSKSKIAPFGEVSGGDIVYIKPTGKDIIGEFRVKKVIFYDSLDSSDFEKIKKDYQKEIAAPEDYWFKKADSKFGTLIFIDTVTQFITPPIKYSKKDLRGWVVLAGE